MKFFVSLILFLSFCFGENLPKNQSFYAKTKQSIINFNKYIGKKLGKDCSDFIMLVNKHHNNIYDFNELSKHYKQGFTRSHTMYNLYKNKGKIVYDEPKIGDLIFFYNTTKSTRNLKTRKITHVSIVKEILSDGTIIFVHNTRKVNKTGILNLNHATKRRVNGKEVNEYIIAYCKQVNCLASQRFAGFGRI